jgi:hypothetical protein
MPEKAGIESEATPLRVIAQLANGKDQSSIFSNDWGSVALCVKGREVVSYKKTNPILQVILP